MKRGEFEKWAVEQGYSVVRSDEHSAYDDDDTTLAYGIWQAASSQHRGVMEDALDGLSTFMEGGPLNCKRVSKAIQSLKQALEV